MNLLKEIKKIHNNEIQAYEYWNEEAAFGDFFMPLKEDLEKVEKTFLLLKTNLNQALKDKNEYIRCFSKFIRDCPEKFQASKKWLDKNWNELFPRMRKK